MSSSVCRIGVFFDGSYFSRAQSFFYSTTNGGWLIPIPFHDLIEAFIRKHEQSFTSHKVVYASWHQGLYHSGQASDRQLRLDRNRHMDLMHAGVAIKYVPMSEKQGEKGVDVALAVDAMEVSLNRYIDVAVLVTGDGDFVPLVQVLMKHGIRTAVVYFEYEHEYNGRTHKGFCNKRLQDCCNYKLCVNELDRSREYQGLFRALFRYSEVKNSIDPLHHSS